MRPPLPPAGTLLVAYVVSADYYLNFAPLRVRRGLWNAPTRVCWA